MAGTAFVIRVAGAAIIFLSQILLARWMGSVEFGIYVYAWTWLHAGRRHHPSRPAADRAALHSRNTPQRDDLDGCAASWSAAAGSSSRPAPLRRSAAHSPCICSGIRSIAAPSCRSISPASRCRSTRCPTCSTDWRGPTTPSTSRCCRRSCCARSLLIAVDGAAHASGIHHRRDHGDGRVRLRHLVDDARSARLLDRSSRATCRPGRGATMSAAGSRPRCRSSRSGRSTCC